VHDRIGTVGGIFDDLALLVDLVTSGWRGVEQRLARIEERLTADGGATVYRMAS